MVFSDILGVNFFVLGVVAISDRDRFSFRPLLETFTCLVKSLFGFEMRREWYEGDVCDDIYWDPSYMSNFFTAQDGD